jgi:hypothetical protein
VGTGASQLSETLVVDAVEFSNCTATWALATGVAATMTAGPVVFEPP